MVALLVEDYIWIDWWLLKNCWGPCLANWRLIEEELVLIDAHLIWVWLGLWLMPQFGFLHISIGVVFRVFFLV